MKNILAIILIASLAAACGNKKEKPKQSPAVTNTDDTTAQCYYFMNDKDTVSLRFRISDGVIDGKLQYIFSEKDKNPGTVIGRMYGDTLLAEYTFQSEGTTSVREVVFLKTGDDFTEGRARNRRVEIDIPKG